MKRNFEERIQEEEIRAIFRYWLERCPPGGIPDWDSINPATIPYQYLPNLFLYQCDGSQRFRCKLVGTDLVRVLGRDETGRYLDETHDGPPATECHEIFAKAVQSALPVYYRYRGVAAHGQQRTFSRILLPVAAGRDRPAQIFGMMLYGPLEIGPAPYKLQQDSDWLMEVVVACSEDVAEDQMQALAM